MPKPDSAIIDFTEAAYDLEMSDDEWRSLDEAVLQRIEDAVAFAKASPFPALDDALIDVYAD